MIFGFTKRCNLMYKDFSYLWPLSRGRTTFLENSGEDFGSPTNKAGDGAGACPKKPGASLRRSPQWTEGIPGLKTHDSSPIVDEGEKAGMSRDGVEPKGHFVPPARRPDSTEDGIVRNIQVFRGGIRSASPAAPRTNSTEERMGVEDSCRVFHP